MDALAEFLTPARTVLLMFALHVLAEFVLQGTLGKMKQRMFWVRACRERMFASYEVQLRLYGRDWISCLAAHALFWSILTLLPLFPLAPDAVLVPLVLVNAAVHALVDDLKANRWRISTNADQALHALQILASYGAFRAVMECL